MIGRSCCDKNGEADGGGTLQKSLDTGKSESAQKNHWNQFTVELADGARKKNKKEMGGGRGRGGCEREREREREKDCMRSNACMRASRRERSDERRREREREGRKGKEEAERLEEERIARASCVLFYGFGIFHSLTMAHPKKRKRRENGWNAPGSVAGNDQR